MTFRIFFAAITALILSSKSYAQDAASLKKALTERFNQLTIPVNFVVKDGAGNYLPDAAQWAFRFQTDPASIYKNYSFSPIGSIEAVAVGDTIISFEAKYDLVRGIKDNVPTFFLENKFHAKVFCQTTSSFNWSCNYEFLDQNYGDRLNPNPIPSVSQAQLATFMGPDMQTLQAKVLEFSNAVVSEQF